MRWQAGCVDRLPSCAPFVRVRFTPAQKKRITKREGKPWGGDRIGSSKENVQERANEKKRMSGSDPGFRSMNLSSGEVNKKKWNSGQGKKKVWFWRPRGRGAPATEPRKERGVDTHCREKEEQPALTGPDTGGVSSYLGRNRKGGVRKRGRLYLNKKKGRWEYRLRKSPCSRRVKTREGSPPRRY